MHHIQKWHPPEPAGRAASGAFPRGGKDALAARDDRAHQSLLLHCAARTTISAKLVALQAEQPAEDEAAPPPGGNGVPAAGEDRLAHNQWQGRDIEFMQSNAHSRERQGQWDTSGLEGGALHIVSSDEKAAK